MDKSCMETDAISLNPVKKMSKYGANTKCHGPMLRSNSFGNVGSRYLKEPIGSCHNLCKNGGKHQSEHDEPRLALRRFMAKKKMVIQMDPSHTGKVVEENTQPGRVGTSDNSEETNALAFLSKHHRAVSSPQFIFPEDPERPTHRSTESFEKDILRNSEQKIQAQVEDDGKAQIQSMEIVESESNINVNSGVILLQSRSSEVILPELPDNLNSSKNKKLVNKPKASSMPKSTTVKINILKQKNSSASTEVDPGDDANNFKEGFLSKPKESTVLTTHEVIKQKNIVMRKQAPFSKFQSNNQNASYPSRKKNSSAKPATPLNVKTPLMMSLSQSNTSRRMNDRMDRKEKTLNSTEMSEVGGIKSLKPERTSISSTIPARNTESLTPRKSRYAQHDQENSSKKLDGHASGSAVGEAIKHSLNGQIQRKYKPSTASKEEDERRARRAPAAQQPADSSSSSNKLKFKRGKVIELRTADSVVPRRLRFRSGRVHGENPSVEVTKRIFRRKRDKGDSNEHNSEARDAMLKKSNLESKAGMLKYQDGHGKKEIRALFNHVIEETANKLVETRKSKVKALVGAFETVISLQEDKPASVLPLLPRTQDQQQNHLPRPFGRRTVAGTRMLPVSSLRR